MAQDHSKPDLTLLKNGNPPGQFSDAPRCMARTRRRTPCQAPACRGKRRCRLHGGRSTGPENARGTEAQPTGALEARADTASDHAHTSPVSAAIAKQGE